MRESGSLKQHGTSFVQKDSHRPASMISAGWPPSPREPSSTISAARKLWAWRRPSSGPRRPAFFAAAPYHHPSDPLERVLAYVAFRKEIITSELAEFTCLVGTMAQEVYLSSPDIRDACGRSIFGHTATLEADIELARRERGITGDWTAASLARHTRTVLQGGFVLAKAGNDPELARESLDHLDRYIRHLFHITGDNLV